MQATSSVCENFETINSYSIKYCQVHNKGAKLKTNIVSLYRGNKGEARYDPACSSFSKIFSFCCNIIFLFHNSTSIRRRAPRNTMNPTTSLPSETILVDANTINQLVNDVANLRAALDENTEHTTSLQDEILSLRAKIKELTEEKEIIDTTLTDGAESKIIASSEAIDSDDDAAIIPNNNKLVDDINMSPSLPMILQCSLCHHSLIPVELRLTISNYYCEEITDTNIHDAVRLSLEEDTQMIAKLQYGHISSWDTSRVTNMQVLFHSKNTFNTNINDWDVSNVIYMGYLFCNCSKFNQPLNKWNTSKVQRMTYLFSYCNEFNQSLNTWDTSNVKCITGMFSGCSKFNQPLEQWNLTNCTLMSNVFNNTSLFNQPLNTWNTHQVKTMDNMFERAIAFNQPLDQWNVQQVTTMKCMFKYAFEFNQSLNAWQLDPNTVNVENMFHLAKTFDANHISEWPNVTPANTPLDYSTKSIDFMTRWMDSTVLVEYEERQLKAVILYTGHGIQFTKLHLRQLKWLLFWLFISFLFMVGFMNNPGRRTEGEIVTLLLVVGGMFLYVKSYITSLRYVP